MGSVRSANRIFWVGIEPKRERENVSGDCENGSKSWSGGQSEERLEARLTTNDADRSEKGLAHCN
jgi:hypothetical protein